MTNPTTYQWGLAHIPRAIVDPGPLGFTHPWEPTGLLPDSIYLKHWWQLPQSRKLLNRLARNLGTTVGQATWPDPTATVDRSAQIVVVPYDFRQSNRDSAQWLARVVDAWADDEPVAVVAHSMGGLVASWWFTALEGWRRCSRLVTVGTPHRGAPKALDFLANLPVRRPRETLRTWPSMYELMPRYPMVRTDSGWLRLAELPTDTLYPAFGPHAARASAFHADLDEAWAQLPEDQWHKVHTIMGTEHATLSAADLTPKGLRSSTEPPPGVPADHSGGDGTVPLVSASPIHHEVVRQAPRGVRHLPLWHSQVTVSSIAGLFVRHLEAIHGSGAVPDDPVVDLELPSQADIGTTMTARARISADTPLDPSDAMRLEIGDPATGVQVVPLTRANSQVFEGQVRFDQPGLVTVRAVLGHRRKRFVDERDVAVLDPADDQEPM